MDMAPEDKGENIRREVCLTLEQMGIFQKAHIMRKDRDRMKLIFVIPILCSRGQFHDLSDRVKTIAGLNGILRISVLSHWKMKREMLPHQYVCEIL